MVPEGWWLETSCSGFLDKKLTKETFRMSSGKYQLTCTKQSDASDIFVLEEASFPPDEAASFETICDRMSEAGKFFYTYRSENGELVGFINGTCILGPKILHESMTNHEPLGRILVIHSVTIKESMRRLKLGTRMLREYITRMKDELSIDQILLLSKANMLTFYVDCGFHLGCLSDVCHGQVGNLMTILYQHIFLSRLTCNNTL